MAMAMFKRKFARTIPDNLRAPYIKMWGFEAKGPESSPELRPEHYHSFFITMLFSSLRKESQLELSGFQTDSSSLSCNKRNQKMPSNRRYIFEPSKMSFLGPGSVAQRHFTTHALSLSLSISFYLAISH